MNIGHLMTAGHYSLGKYINNVKEKITILDLFWVILK